ncbi:MAG: DUF4127 family protein [Eubacteriales bacterium]|nr:DUF4127 family protein [Eubacteriales bacterium]
MRRKIVLLPLDERPCNAEFPAALFGHGELEIVRPQSLGDKKKRADEKTIEAYLRRECADADGLVLSVDMLLYGGLVPSRIHHDTLEQLQRAADVIRDLKKENPALLVFAFQVIMRCPDYSSDDEEPEYYEICGEAIHRTGEIVHKGRLGLNGDGGMNGILPEIDPDYLNDYVGRRELNREMNAYMLRFLEEGSIDFMVIPQDDAARYGYAAMDQEAVRSRIIEKNLSDRILIYPGADEVGLTLIGRMINKLSGKKPKVYIKYLCEQAKTIIPLYEGNTLSGTIKYHLLAAGCCTTESYEQADMILVVTAPAGQMKEAVVQPCPLPEYRTERNYPEMLDFITDRMAEGKIVTIADNAYANGGDLELIRLLDHAGLLLAVDGYAGWNTSANTLGTAIAEGIDAYYSGRSSSHTAFLLQRYLEDAGYCSVVRQQVTQELEAEGEGLGYFDVREERGEAAHRVARGLAAFAGDYLSSIADDIIIEDVHMPWRRMFEVGFRARLRDAQ